MQARFDKQERLYQTIRMMRPIHIHMQRTAEAQLAGTGISVAQRDMMEVLDGEGRLTVAEAAQRLCVSRQFAQRKMTALARAGHVVRESGPVRSSPHLYSLSDSGRRIFRDIRERQTAALRQHLGDINMTEAIVALRVISRIASAFKTTASEAPAQQAGHAA